MTDVDKVALWAGLIASVAGIVLSIVAMVLSIVSNNRATAVNDQTIKSLQKIESAVERLSDDSRTLIKAGWEKMLGSFTSADDDAQDDAIEGDIADITPNNTVDVELQPPLGEDGLSQEVSALREELRQLKQTLVKRPPRDASWTKPVDILVKLLTRLSPNAQALFEVLALTGHLTEDQFRSLTQSPLGPELSELLKEGLLERLSGVVNGQKSPVYWLPSQFARAAKVAVQLAPQLPASIKTYVRGEVTRIGHSAP